MYFDELFSRSIDFISNQFVISNYTTTSLLYDLIKINDEFFKKNVHLDVCKKLSENLCETEGI